MPKAPPGFVNAEPYSWPHDNAISRHTTALVIIDMQNDCKRSSTESPKEIPINKKPPVCSEGGYMTNQGIDITPTRQIIPRIKTLLDAFRASNFPIYHTREGHRPDLSTLSSREAHRSRVATGSGIGDAGPMGRLLVRGEHGQDTIAELYPLEGEPVIEKPGRSAFQHTDFKLLLDVKGIRNLVLCGVTTDVCVTSTMRDANDRGLDCLLVADACAAGEEDLHEAAVRMVGTEGGIFGATAGTEDVLRALREVAGL